MRLEEIELFGFKTFLKTTKIVLSDRITCIVGPNGSGKSNIVDAIRWVLGEGRLSLLRAADSSDLIFSGSSMRQPLNLASVKLIFNNEDRFFPVATPKVILERRIYRERDSRYYLNGEESSLQNILSIFNSAGIFGYSFAIVGQGRVEEVVLAKPEEKKHMIDRIAGIDVFKRKKDEALRKLAETEENLLRAHDRLEELRQEAKRVIDESQKAHMYYFMMDRLRRMEFELFNGIVSALKKELTSIRTSIDEIEKEEAEIAEKILEAKKEFEQIEGEYREAFSESEKLKARREELLVEKARIAEKENSIRERVRTGEEKITELNVRKERLQSSKELLTHELAKLKEDVEEMKAKRLLMSGRKEELNQLVVSIQSELQPLLKAKDEFERKVNEIQETRVKKEKLIGAIEVEISFLEEKSREIESELFELEGLESEDLEYLEKQMTELREEKSLLEKSIASLREEVSFKKYRAAELKKVVHLAGEKCSFEPGTLGEMLRVSETKPGLEDELNAFVVQSIEEIIGKKSGHFFLSDFEPANSPEELTPVSELLGVDSALLSNVFMADSVSNAIEAFRKYAGKCLMKKIITRDGFVVLSPFEVKVNSDIVAIEKRKELLSLEEDIKRQELELVSMTRKEEQLEKEIQKIQTNIFRAQQIHEKISRQPLLESELKEVREKLLSDTEKLQSLRQEVKNMFVRESFAEAEAISQKREAIDNAKQELAKVENTIGEISYKLEMSEKHAEDIIKRLSAIDEEASAIESRILETKLEVEENGKELTKNVDVLNKQSLILGELEEEINLTKQKVDSLRKSKHEIEARIERYSEQKEQVQARKQKLLVLLAEKETEIKANLREMEEKGIEFKEVTYSVNESKMRSDIRALKEEVDKIGPIDFTSLEKEENVRKELEEREELYKEVRTAKRELEKFISETEKRIKEEFDKTIGSIEENFSKIFGRITHGGEATIDRLFDDTGEIKGVELSVRFPGKRKQPLPLLSGGEKALTALAFLFAVFKVKSFPFYVLDEVDASLDDENILRFRELLSEESATAQYIVITHNKQTMEAAEILYGITMEEEGISKVVSLKLV